MNKNKGSVVKHSGNDVEGYRSQKILFQLSVLVFLQYSVSEQLKMHKGEDLDCKVLSVIMGHLNILKYFSFGIDLSRIPF